MTYINDLKNAVREAQAKLLSIPNEAAGQPLAPGKWSPKQIMGHLIDSASNNHQRFVRAQFQENMIFPGYRQEQWVEVQAHQKADWAFLVNFWAYYNLHLAFYMKQIPDEIRLKEHKKHNLHKIAMRTIPEDQTTTLDYFMDDYVFHLKHHLNQIYSKYP